MAVDMLLQNSAVMISILQASFVINDIYWLLDETRNEGELSSEK